MQIINSGVQCTYLRAHLVHFTDDIRYSLTNSVFGACQRYLDTLLDLGDGALPAADLITRNGLWRDRKDEPTEVAFFDGLSLDDDDKVS